MSEFLTSENIISDNSEVKTEPFHTKEIVHAQNIRYQMIESFTKKNVYHGKSILQYSQKLLSSLAREKEISQGVFFISDKKDDKPVLKFLSGYAYQNPENNEEILEFGEGFPGQVAKDGKLLNIADIPEGYLPIESGLGKASPVSLIIFPVIHDEKVLAVIELASFHKFSYEDELFFQEISPSVAEQIQKCIAKS
jgi:GAF domain-containing protein